MALRFTAKSALSDSDRAHSEHPTPNPYGENFRQEGQKFALLNSALETQLQALYLLTQLLPYYRRYLIKVLINRRLRIRPLGRNVPACGIKGFV